MNKLIIGKNDLLSCNPELAAEYDKEKNVESIENIFAQSGKKVWWKCKNCGYEWQSDFIF